jgi:hypothetical protein
MAETAVALPSAPSSGAATTGAPTSFQGLDWSEPSSGSSPTEIPADPSPPASATVSPDPAATPDGSPQQPPGPIPFDRHQAILANQRQEAVTKFLTEQGLAGYAPEQLKAIAPWIQKASTDPEGFLIGELTSHPDPVGLLRQTLQRLQTDPRHAATIRSLVGQAMQSLRGQPTQTPPPMVKVQFDDGSIVDMPRDPGAWLQYHQQQWLKQMDDRFAPVTQTVDQLREQQQAAAQAAQVDSFVQSRTQDILTWEGMNEPANQKALAVEMGKIAIDPWDFAGIERAANIAYRRVVVPTIRARSESQLLDRLKTQAAASTGINPGSAAPSAARPITKFSDLGQEAWR